MFFITNSEDMSVINLDCVKYIFRTENIINVVDINGDEYNFEYETEQDSLADMYRLHALIERNEGK